MQISLSTTKRTLLASAALFSLISTPLLMADTFLPTSTDKGIITIAANTVTDGNKGNKGSGSKQNGSGSGGQQGGKKGMDKVLEADEDSDRPAWAGGNPTANPHSGGGEGKPSGAGTKKGDDYGDLIVLLRNPITGEPLTDANGEYLICLDVACTTTVPTVEGEVPAGVVAIEVEFGRAAVGRAPSKVSDKALSDAIEKLTVEGAVITQDEAGRLTITIDGVSSTIDSPLENLALYIDLMTGLATSATSATEEALGSLATLDTAASLLAGVADKTGDITVDYIVYNNIIVDVVESGDYYDFSTFSYSRSFPTDYTYNYTPDGGVTILSATLNVNDYLDSVNGTLTTDGGVTLFAAAADDAVEVIELIHTQIHDGILPGTVTP